MFAKLHFAEPAPNRSVIEGKRSCNGVPDHPTRHLILSSIRRFGGLGYYNLHF